MANVKRDVSYLMMTSHGEATRAASSDGYLIFSNLAGGSSRIIAAAPSLKFALTGEEIYEIDGRRRILSAGQFLLVEAGAEVSVRTSNIDRSLGLCLYLPSVGPAAPAAELMREAVVFGAQTDRLTRLLKAHTGTLAARPDLGPHLANRLMHELKAGLENFLGDVHHRADRLSVAKASTRIETLRRLELARSYIHASAGVPITLDEVARFAAMSRFHLTRRFNEVYGVPPLTYHRQLRLDDAAEKLRRRERSATELAEELGYGSLSAFVRAFRQRTGISPGRWAELGDASAVRFDD